MFFIPEEEKCIKFRTTGIRTELLKKTWTDTLFVQAVIVLSQTKLPLLIWLDFPVREVHCDARAETEWEKLAQNLQLKVGLQLDPPWKQKLT